MDYDNLPHYSVIRTCPFCQHTANTIVLKSKCDRFCNCMLIFLKVFLFILFLALIILLVILIAVAASKGNNNSSNCDGCFFCYCFGPSHGGADCGDCCFCCDDHSKSVEVGKKHKCANCKKTIGYTK